MKTMFEPGTRAALERRVQQLRADSGRRWGSMSPHQAICHLSDAFRAALGDKPIESAPRRAQALMRFVALHVPLNWPAGVETLPEVEQGVGGTPPVEFERDRRELAALINRFYAHRERGSWPAHPIFGALSTREWGVWAYRHMDHHLRQFGC